MVQGGLFCKEKVNEDQSGGWQGQKEEKGGRGVSCKQETSEDQLGRGWLFNEEILGTR